MSLKSTIANNEDDLAFLSEQLQELDMDETFENDLELAFRLQMEEAINASYALQPYSSSSSPASQPSSSSVTASLQHPLSSAINSPSTSFAVALQPSSYAEVPSVHPNAFRLYFKGLVCDEIIDNSKVTLAGIGVFICDPLDNHVFQLHKPLLLNNETSRQVVEFKALIEGLNSVLTLGLKQVTIVSDYFSLYQYIKRRWIPKQRKLRALIDEVHLLCRKFDYCGVTLIARSDIKLAFKLAREAIISQITKANDHNELMETCLICLEDITAPKMLTIPQCRHFFCYSCMKQHGEVKLLHGMIPRCPQEGCNSELELRLCEKFLNPKFMEMMKQRLKEAGIPVTERVYCPYPRCSALMTKKKVTEYAENAFGHARSGTRKCIKCHGLFCIDCKVPWHSNMSCDDYKKLNPFPSGEDQKLKSLATKNLWRQCVKCNHIIELSEGCYHMTCRCGYEFCYSCGAEWRNKKATCTCPLWIEDNIIHDEDDIIYDDEDEGEFYDDDDDDDDLDDDDGEFNIYDDEDEVPAEVQGGSNMILGDDDEEDEGVFGNIVHWDEVSVEADDRFVHDEEDGRYIHGEDEGNIFHGDDFIDDWSDSGGNVVHGECKIIDDGDDSEYDDDGNAIHEEGIILDEEDEEGDFDDVNVIDDEDDYMDIHDNDDDTSVFDDSDTYW